MAVKAGLSRKHLSGWDKGVADILLRIVNDYGVRYRMPDGRHMLLYPPDRSVRPFKVALSRPGEVQVGYLEKFIETWNLTDKEQEMTTMFTQADTGPNEVAVAPEPTEEPQAPEIATEWVPGVPATAKGNPIPGEWETDGTMFRCVTCHQQGRLFVKRDMRALGGHYRLTHGEVRGKAASPEAKAKAANTRRAKRVKAEVTDALAVIVNALGVDSPAEVERLRSELAAATKRAEEAETRLALAREAMGL